MEQLGLAPAVMRKRVEEVLDLLGLAALRDRPLSGLSGGEQQRVAIGAVITAQPRVLVLDEPTSALDPAAAEDVLAALTRLVHDLGMTVVLAEHRLERVVQYADRVVAVAADGSVTDGRPQDVLATAAVVPPIVDLGLLAGWDPLPLSVRDARRRAPALRARLAPGIARDVGGPTPPMPEVLTARDVHVQHGRLGSRRRPGAGPTAETAPAATGGHAVRGVDLTLRAGDVVALMGRNGSGKTSLLWALQGSGRRSRGSVEVAPGPSDVGPEHADPARLSPRDARRRVALVPNTPQDLLFRESVAAECAEADGSAPGTTRALLDDLAPGIPDRAHPRDLSEGQRLALALAVQLAATPRVLLLDEPTRGLDYAAKRHLARVLVRHAADGGAVLLSSHDVEFVAECASRVVVMADGDVVADGHHDHPGGALRDELHVVAGQQNRTTVRCVPDQHPGQVSLRGIVQAAGRLVEQQDARGRGELDRQCQCQALTLREVARVRSIGDPGGQVVQQGTGRPGRRSVRLRALGRDGFAEQQVLRGVRHQGHPAPRVAGGQPRGVGMLRTHVGRAGRHLDGTPAAAPGPLQRPEQRRLARAVAAHQGDDVAGPKGQVHPAHRMPPRRGGCGLRCRAGAGPSPPTGRSPTD